MIRDEIKAPRLLGVNSARPSRPELWKGCCFYCILRSPRMLFWTNLVCRLPGGTLYRTHELAHPIFIMFRNCSCLIPSVYTRWLQSFEHRSPPCLFRSARSSPAFRGSAQADFCWCASPSLYMADILPSATFQSFPNVIFFRSLGNIKRLIEVINSIKNLEIILHWKQLGWLRCTLCGHRISISLS